MAKKGNIRSMRFSDEILAPAATENLCYKSCNTKMLQDAGDQSGNCVTIAG